MQAGCSKCPNCSCAMINASGGRLPLSFEAMQQEAAKRWEAHGAGQQLGSMAARQTSFSVKEVVLVLKALKAQYCGPNNVPVTGAEMMQQVIRTFEGME